MKIAVTICLLLAGFLAGWLLNAPQGEGDVLPNDAPEPIVLSGKESAAWQAQVRGKTTDEVVTAIYEDAMEADFDDKYALFRSLMEKDRSTSRELNARMLIMSMDQEELQQAIQQARFEDANRRTMDLLYARFVDLDRDAAWAYFLAQPDPDEVSILSYYIFKRWVLDDQAAAMAAWSQLDEKTQGSRLRTMVESLSEVDVNAALQLQLAYGKMTSSDSYAYRDVIRKWAQQDLASAREALALVPRGAHEDAYSAYFDVLIESDRGQAMEQAQALEGFTDKKRALSQIYRNWLDEDVDGALAALANESTPEDYFSSWTLARDHPEKLMTWAFENMSGNEQDYIIGSAMRSMVREDNLEMAMNYLATLPYGEAYERSLSSLASEWAEDDPQAAIAWARQLEDPSDQRRALGSVMWRYARDDPEAAKALYLSLDAEQQGHLDDNIIRPLTQRDPLEAMAWIDSLPGDVNRTELREQAYQEWARQDGSGLFDHLGIAGFKQLPENQRRDLLRQWADYSPKDSSAWLEGLKTDDLPENEVANLYGQVASQWLDHDTYEASEWIAGLPSGKARESAVRNLVSEIRDKDPAAAWEWVIDTGENHQLGHAESVLRSWQDKDAAYRALVTSQLSDEDVNKLAQKYFADRAN